VTDAPTAVILAGGLGTRIRHLLDGRPKPLAPVDGRPFLEWVIRFLAKQGIGDMIISAGYRAEMIADFCAGFPMRDIRLRCVAEPAPRGTAGGFLEAIAGDESPAWLVCNGDSLVCADLRPFIAYLDDDEIDGALVGLHVTDGSRYGNLRCDEDSNLAGFDEKAATSKLINGGIYLLRPRLLAAFPPTRPLSFETEVFPALVRAGARIRLHRVEAAFIDIGTEASLQEAELFIQTNRSHFL
jgi:D-glycero-alpha-D-manno-heptose 1-phosphate guanylyltransferase